MPKLSSWVLLGALAPLCVACRPGVGACTSGDMRAARTLVYDSSGAPAYAGQAILVGSCAGGGSFCHAESATDRYGAPGSLNLDPIRADDPRYPDEAAGAAHLYAAQRRAHRERDDIYGTVWDRSMPPGQAGLDTQTGAYRIFASDADTVGTPMPGLDSNEGLELLRAWLACGSPVVEATTAITTAACATDQDCAPVPACDTTAGRCVPVGAVVARRTGGTSASWSSVYATVLAPTCATPACHGAAGAAFSGDLDLSSAAAAYAALVGIDAHASGCGTRVTPGSPDSSFLVAKVQGTQDPAMCGEAMPIGTMLPADQITAIRDWIAAGAAND
jgi:hypothetical protein